MMGWDTAIYLLIASIIISVAMAPKIQQPSPTAFDEIDFPSADEVRRSACSSATAGRTTGWCSPWASTAPHPSRAEGASNG